MAERRIVLWLFWGTAMSSLSPDLDPQQNTITGSPIVECDRDFVRFSVPTLNNFRGRVYVKGEYGNADCVRIYDLTESADPTKFRDFQKADDGASFLKGDRPAECPPCDRCDDGGGGRRRRQSSSVAELDVRLSSCNVHRDRTQNPPGVHISFVVVVSFHHSFVTKRDRAYRVDCMYSETDKTVTTKMDVSMPPTIELSSTMEAPKCEYRIRLGNGMPLLNARVGDKSEHEWKCSSANGNELSDEFGMLVHDCYVEDGKGRKQLVIDSKGCSLDSFIMPTPHYSRRQMMATVSALIVKFPDRDQIGFQCAISVCSREAGLCDSVTPPLCDGLSSNRSRRSVSRADWKLHSQQFTVFDPSMDNQIGPPLAISAPLAEICISVAGFGVLVASSTFLFTFLFGLISFYLFIRKIV